MGFFHGQGHPQPRQGDNTGRSPDGGENFVTPLRHQAQQQSADGITRIAPVPIDTEDTPSLQRWGRVGHGGDQVRVQERHA